MDDEATRTAERYKQLANDCLKLHRPDAPRTEAAKTLTSQPPSIHRQFNDAFPQIAAAYRRVINKHFASAADEHREGASDASVKRHDDEYRAAETDFITALHAELIALREDKARVDWLEDNLHHFGVDTDIKGLVHKWGFWLRDSKPGYDSARNRIDAAREAIWRNAET